MYPGYHHALAVVPSDAANTDFGFTQKALFVGAAGTLKVRTSGDEDVTFTAVPAGATIPITVKRVFVSGTSATGVVALGD
jgi:hypothetical protein